jgi:hypothetical protein
VYGLTNNATPSATYIGYQAGNTSTATDNTAIGYNVLSANTTGANNVGVGGQRTGQTGATLLANTTGSYNVALGISALRENTTASNNVGIGYSALFLNTTGANNTAVGHSSGSSMTTGSKNVIIGSYSGNQDGLDMRTASNYAVISDGDGNRLLTAANGYSLAIDGGGVPQSGSGITFPSSQNACADANTLDDYEEGTWTPIDGSGASLSLTVSGTSTYTKIGRVVNATCHVAYPSTANSSNASIGGLPFTVASTGSINMQGGIIGNTNRGVTIYVMALQGDTRVVFTDVSDVNQTNANMSTKTIRFTAVYIV